MNIPGEYKGMEFAMTNRSFQEKQLKEATQHSCTHVNVFLDTGWILRSCRVRAYPNTVLQSMSRVAAPEL